MTLPTGALIVDAGPGLKGGLSIRQQCELLRAQAELERASFIAHWMELNNFGKPRRGRFMVTDVNRGDRRTQKIVDSTATMALRTCSAGMMSGMSSPARPWFRLVTPDADLNEQPEVKDYLYEVTRRMQVAFVRSNLYNALPILYTDMALFGTSAMAMLDDDERIFRFYPFPIGSYAMANDPKMRVRTFVRSFQMTVEQLVTRWGEIDPSTGKPNFVDGRPTTISQTTQNLWLRGNLAAWMQLVHVVRPNVAYNSTKIESKYKKYESIYYEMLTPRQATGLDDSGLGLLAHEGFEEFPVFTPRWEVNAEDIYGTDCPGMTALGDIKELQLRVKRTAQAVEKMINPPLIGPGVMRSAAISLLPGGVTYADIREGQQGLKPIHEVDFGAAMKPMEDGSVMIRERIQRAFYEDLFLMLSQSDRREITAREVDERHEEKLLALGPMLEQTNQDLYDPLIERAFNMMARKGVLPPPPDALRGLELRVDYLSIMAQAQKLATVNSLDRFAGIVGQITEFDPTAIDNMDVDQFLEHYGEAISVPPLILRSPEAMKILRDARSKAQQQQAAAENAPKVAGAVQALGNTPASGDNMLQRVMGRSQANRTLNATAGPPAPVSPLTSSAA